MGDLIEYLVHQEFCQLITKENKITGFYEGSLNKYFSSSIAGRIRFMKIKFMLTLL